MNDKLLHSLGITDSEAKLYKAALKSRKATPAVLGRLAGIKRTTAYQIARALVEKGLLIEDSTRRPRLYSVATPENIHELIDSEHKKFEAREKILNQLAHELAIAATNESYPIPRVRFIEENKLERFLYKEVPAWHKSIMEKDATWWGFQDHAFIDQYGKITNWYWKREKESFFVKLLSDQSDTERRWSGKYPKRIIKFWNKANNFVSTIWIAGEYVIMVNTRRHPFYLVEIRDAALANDLREVFKNLWPLV